MSEGAGDGSGGTAGVKPGALTALLQEVAASPEKREEEPLSLPPGTVIGRFEIIRELGRGGFGVVYEARDRDLGRQVAVKVVRPGRITEEEGKVSREAEAIARLAHPNLITLFEVGRSEHGPFLVFELLRGKTLDLRIEEGPLPVQEAVHVATEVARGLAHAHAEGVIHRDLKPANVFVTNKGHVKILDFGMAHAFGRRRLSGGTPAYMAPEQWEDAPEDERTDVFALGVMLYRMLTGEYPFPEGMGKWSAEPATLRKLDVPGAPELAELAEKMLDPIPTRRPRDGAAVLAALTPIEEKLRAKPVDGKPPEHAKRRKATFGDLLAELKRRHVFRVMVGYGIFSFAVLQVTEPIMHGADLPNWVLKAVLVALVLGFPVAVILAWAYDLTAQGVKRTPSAAGPGAPRFGKSRLLLPLAVSATVLAIAAVGAGAWYAWKRVAEQRPAAPAPSASPFVAVLPFVDLSPSKDQGYLSDGIAEEVLQGLAQVEGLKVVGRTTSFSYRGKDSKAEEIGRELKVGAVLEGSVRKAGDQVRIAVNLVSAADGTSLWAKTFDRRISDVFAVQEEIGIAVVEALRLKLLPGARVARTGGTSDPEAFRLFLNSRDQIRSGNVEEIRQAVRALEQAVSLDPRFAMAWASLAVGLVWIESDSGSGDGQSPARRRRAQGAASKAVELAPRLADAYVARAEVRGILLQDWSGAREDAGRARELAPGDAEVINASARAHFLDGQLDRAKAEAERAVGLDPRYGDAWLSLGVTQLSSGDHERARSALRRALELSPQAHEARFMLVLDLITAGQPAEALVESRKSPLEMFRLVGEALALHDLGRVAEARGALDRLTRERSADVAYQIAEIHARWGEVDRAFEWLERARQQHDTGLFWIKTDPLLQKIRGDPRFAAFLRRLNVQVDSVPGTAGATEAVPATPSIAVLPFADMSPKHDQEYFADGVADQILSALAHVEGLKVVGRTSSFSFKGKSDDLKAIGQKLDVANILEGSLRKDGNGIRVTAQLIRVADGTHLWSESYDRKLTGIFKVQDEIAEAVVEALRVRLLPGKAPTTPALRTANPEVYQLVLLGRERSKRGTLDDWKSGLVAFERALALDPDYAPAWAGLALQLRWIEGFGGGGLSRGRRQRALDAADRAVALAPGLADGFWVRANIRMSFAYDWAGARSDLERARALSPSDADVVAMSGHLLMALGRFPEAIVLLRRGTEIDPLSALAWERLGVVLTFTGDVERGMEAIRRSLEIAPEGPLATQILMVNLTSSGRAEAALDVARKARVEWLRSSGEALALHKLGRTAEARAALGRLIASNSDDCAYQIAQVLASWGERDEALDWLERAHDQHDSGLSFVKANPLLRPLHADPRYTALLRKMNLPVD